MNREAAGGDMAWWQQKKAASLERKAKTRVRTASAHPGDSFLIVTEGQVTEPVYFNLLCADLQIKAVQVKVIPGRRSDPCRVIETAANEAAETKRKARTQTFAANQPAKYDQVWAVIDTDAAVREGRWAEVVRLAAEKIVKLAPSTPCFEFWLLLHLAYTTRSDLVDGDTAKLALQQALGRAYSTNRQVSEAVMPGLLGHWVDAVEHARRVRRHHREAGASDPANPSTEVDLLVTALKDAAPDHARKDL